MSSQKQVPVVDLRYMTQADIQALAASSPTLFDFESLTTTIPILDPSTLNESASSRKQTFAHVPLNTDPNNAELIPKPGIRRFSRHKNPNSILGIRPREDDVQNKETHQIASALKELFVGREKTEIFEKLDREVMNLKGEVVDLEELGKKEYLYEDVIGKRTEGLEKEDQLLGYMGLLDGKWGSSRKKSKMVDAGLYGCELPKGWKVMLALKRKDRRVFLHCREFVSPGGKHFANCKEVSSYILSLNVHHDWSQQISGQHSLSASNTDNALGNMQNSPRNKQWHLSGLDDLSTGSMEPLDFALFTGQPSTSAPTESFPDHQLGRGTPSDQNPTNSVPTALFVVQQRVQSSRL